MEQLLSRGYGVRAGSLDLDKARNNLPRDPNLEFVSSSNWDLQNPNTIASSSFRHSQLRPFLFSPKKICHLTNLLSPSLKMRFGSPLGIWMKLKNPNLEGLKVEFLRACLAFDGISEKDEILIAPLVLQVRADVTEGSEQLAKAIGDADAVICATGFRYSWDIFAPWKVTH